MFVKMWMTRNPVTVLPNATISSAAMEMRRRKIRHLPVAEPKPEGERLVGIVSKYDVVRAFPGNLNPFSIEVFEDTLPGPVSAIMTRDLHTTSPNTPIEEAARILRAHKIGALPVLHAGTLAGIITESDIFDAFLVMTGANRGGVRITLETGAIEDSVPTVTELGRRYGMQTLSLLSFYHCSPQSNAERGVSIFRFAGTYPDAFLDQVWKLGFRVVSILESIPHKG